MMSPVQRVMHYKIHLEDILKNTHPLDPTFAKIKEALKAAASLASFIDSVIEQQKGLEQLIAIPSKVKGCPVQTYTVLCNKFLLQ